MTAFRTVTEAQETAALMTQYDNVRVRVDPDPDLAGRDVIYITATDPMSLLHVYLTGPDDEPHRLGTV